MIKKLIVILGPTATGKTELAIRLAKKFNGEIVSADSRQVYRGMDIGTGKVTKKEMRGIPHHLIDVIFPNQEFNAAIFKKLAVKIIKDIQKRKKLPFLVGGTGLYIRAIVDNLKFPKTKPDKKLREKLEKKSAEELFEIYKKSDEEGAKNIDKKNKRRLIRAIEVCRATGKPFWEQRKKGAKLLFDVLQIGIKLLKRELKKRIKKRVEKMFKMGLEKEVKKLVKEYGSARSKNSGQAGSPQNGSAGSPQDGWIPPLRTIGYQEWRDYLDKKITKNEVKNLIISHTIQFAKRQMTWFKKYPAPEQARRGAGKRIHWLKNYPKAKKLIKTFLKKELSSLRTP